MFLDPAAANFSVEGGVAEVELTGVEASGDSGWSVLNRLTVVVIDGPGDEGFFLPRVRSETSEAAPEGWDEAVDRNGGVWVAVTGSDPQRLFAGLIP